jgi:4-hydroxy-4-methyl-2-oxoglutarate aldolase
MSQKPSPDIYRELAEFDSSSVANAVETFGQRLRNVGFSGAGITPRNVLSPPMVGAALTLKVRSADPPMKPGFYLEQEDWWERIPDADAPRVLVIEDVDTQPGRGALVGPAHACILKALGFTGVVTTGALRGERKFAEIGLSAYSGNLSPSHAYCHVLEVGMPVTVAGVRIETGDVIHGDQDGIVSIPPGLAPDVPEAARRFMERERRICAFCSGPGFSREKLRPLIQAEARRLP